MSFDALKASDVTRKTKDIDITVGENVYRFTAKEISAMQRMHMANVQKNGGDPFQQLIVYSITDPEGKHMTLEQAEKLDDVHALAFFSAAAEVNGYAKLKKTAEEETDEKN